ncbi:MAG: SpoIIE family protein phosphatase [Planctomycetes bacterium]|nr:SpoIIE family protein phosphatase [Planctomycetota bacterium]
MPPHIIPAATTDRPDRRIAALTDLLDVALKLGTEHDLTRILQIVTNGACHSVNCERASLFLLDDAENQLYTHVVTELEIRQIRLGIEHGICGWVARNRELTHVSIPSCDDRWDSSFDVRTGFVTRNILATPVFSNMDGRLLGVLQLLNKTGGDFSDFDKQLIQAFAAHAATSLDRRQMQEESLRAQELKQSMEMGRRIQRGFLPDSLPNVPGYDVASWWEPAVFVSGDYYDWLPLPDGRTCFVMADVSGHGLGPSLIMASLRAMLHVLVRTVSAPDRIVELLAETIAPDLKQSQFVSFLLVSLDPVTHSVQFANAGHAPALHFHCQTGEFECLQATRLPLGFPAIDVGSVNTQRFLAAGDLLVLGTDGVIEVRDPAGSMFGTKRLQEILSLNWKRPAAEIVAAVSEAVQSFHGDGPPADDSTLVVIKRVPSS